MLVQPKASSKAVTLGRDQVIRQAPRINNLTKPEKTRQQRSDSEQLNSVQDPEGCEGA